MAGISTKAANIQENKFKYNTWERNEDLSLEIDESFYRVNDYQTGKFWQVDPKTENMEIWSPYASNYDNPVRFNDPKGDQPGCCDGDPIVAITQLAKDFFDNGVVPAVAWFNRNLNPVYGIANGAKVLATGTNFDGQQQSPVSGVSEIGVSLIPGASLEKGALKQVEQSVVQEGAEAGEKAAGKSVGAFSEVKGHHVHAKAGFEGTKWYDPMKAFAVSEKALQSHGVKHSQVTGQQIKLFTQAGKNGAANNLTTHSRVAFMALVGAGIPKEVAKEWVLASQSQLIRSGSTVPTKIPWVK